MGLPSEQNLVSQIVEFGLNFLFLRDSNHKERFSIWTNKKQCLSDWANQVIWNSCSMFGIVAQWLDLLSDKDKIWNYILLKSGIQIKHLYIYQDSKIFNSNGPKEYEERKVHFLSIQISNMSMIDTHLSISFI